MADSAADSTVANADTLKRELKKTLTEILSHGENRGETDRSFGVLKAIDEAIRILTCLREVKSKKPESDVSSSSPSPKVEVPKEFICTLSNTIMIEPVVIASGQTFEKRYITQWLAHERKCPKSNEVLSHCLWTPNHSVDELITQWCRANKYDRLKPSDEIVTELSFDGIQSLLQRISIPSSLEDHTEAAKELRRQTEKFPNVRNFFCKEILGSITRLISLLSVQDKPVSSNPEIQENIVTALFNLSTVEKNKSEFADHPRLIPLLTKSMRQGTDKARWYSAATLLSLSASDSNKTSTDSELLEALKELIFESEDMLASLEANVAVFKLCLKLKNWEKAVSVGLIPALISKIEAGRNAAGFLGTLYLFSTHEQAIKQMEDLGFIKYLFGILRKPCCLATCDTALAIVLNICSRSITPEGNRVGTRLTVVDKEEIRYGTFTKLTKHESDAVVRRAGAILKYLKTHGTGKQPQMG